MRQSENKSRFLTGPKLLLWLSLMGILLVPAPSKAETDKIAVMPITFQRVNEDVVAVLNELLLNHVDSITGQTIIGASDINSMLGLDRMKNAIGCDDVSCAAEIGGALGVDYLLVVNVGVLGDKLILSAKLIDIGKTEVAERASLQVNNDERFFQSGLISLIEALFGKKAKTQSISTLPSVADEAARSGKSSNYLDVGVGFVSGEDDNMGPEVEAAYRHMFGDRFGTVAGLLLGYQVDEGIKFGIRLALHLQLSDFLGVEVGFRGLPTHIGEFGGPSLGLYLGSFYARGGVNILGNASSCVDLGYSFSL